jgi:hypothetical protein
VPKRKVTYPPAKTANRHRRPPGCQMKHLYVRPTVAIIDVNGGQGPSRAFRRAAGPYQWLGTLFG